MIHSAPHAASDPQNLHGGHQTPTGSPADQVAHSLMLPERALGQIHVDFSEMDQHFNTDCSLMFLSARPGAADEVVASAA